MVQGTFLKSKKGKTAVAVIKVENQKKKNSSNAPTTPKKKKPVQTKLTNLKVAEDTQSVGNNVIKNMKQSKKEFVSQNEGGIKTNHTKRRHRSSDHASNRLWEIKMGEEEQVYPLHHYTLSQAVPFLLESCNNHRH